MTSESFAGKREKPDELALGREEIRLALAEEYARGRDPLSFLSAAAETGSQLAPDLEKLVSGLEKEDIEFWNLLQRGDIVPKDAAAYQASLHGRTSESRLLFAQYAMNRAQVMLMGRGEMDRLDRDYRDQHPEPDAHDQNIRI